ncbi:MAG: response regulator transcription factor, partial [bacterium]|nr:response regulator transcription factor [bacterium]
MIRVLLVDDDDLVRVGMAMSIESTDDVTVVSEASKGTQAITEAARLEPDIVLMDVQMPDGDGSEATRQILSVPDTPTRVIMV